MTEYGSPVDGIENRWSLFKEVPTIVDEKFEDGRDLTQDMLRLANEAMAELKSLAEGLTLTECAVPASVEDAIFDRETERALLLHKDALDNIAAEWSKRGFTLPNANLLAALSIAETEYMNKRLDISRDIAIKSWELTDANTKFYVKLAHDLKMEAEKAIGAISAQMVAGAFSSVSASVHMDASNAANYSYSSNPSY